MTKVKQISTLYIMEIEHEGSEYHITITDDLKTIYDIDTVNGPGGLDDNPTLILEIIWEAMLSREIENFD